METLFGNLKHIRGQHFMACWVKNGICKGNHFDKIPLPVTEPSGSAFLLASALEILKPSTLKDMKQSNKMAFKKPRPSSQAKD